MNKPVLLLVLTANLQAGFKNTMICVSNFKPAKGGKTLDKIFF